MYDVQATINKLLDGFRQGFKNVPQTVELLEACYHKLPPDSRETFFNLLSSALFSYPLPSGESGQAPRSIHPVIVAAWSRFGPTSKLVYPLFSLIRADKPDTAEAWAREIFPQLNYCLFHYADRFEKPTLDAIKAQCTIYTYTRRAGLSSSEYPPSLVDAVADLERTIEGIEFERSVRDLTPTYADGEINREGFASEAPQALLQLSGRDSLIRDTERLLAGRTQLGVIYVNLDGFKSVNDTLGHPSGDKCLEKVVEIIGAAVAGKGRLYRYGGDEFVVLLPNFLTAEAAATAERIRAAIDESNPGGEIKVTASIGVTSSDQPQLGTAEELIKAADEAMYVSKNAGKNRVTSWPLTHDGQQPQRRPIFEAEFKGGKYIVYLSERGASPFTSICATFRIYNRRGSSTTVLCDSFRVKLDGRTDDFPLPDINPLGAIGPVLESHDREQVGASSIIDLNFSSCKYYPEPIPDAYLSRKKVHFVALLKETFGTSVEAEGELECGDIVRR